MSIKPLTFGTVVFVPEYCWLSGCCRQKLEEQRRLCDMILDASVRLGEMTKAIPQSSGKRTDLEPIDSDVARLATKTDTIRGLGFSPKQVQRFETLADNKDLVEQEKALASTKGGAAFHRPHS